MKIWAKFKYGTDFMGLNDTREININGTITLNSKPHLTNWKLTTTSKLEDFEWSESPSILVAGRKVPITYIINPTLSIFKSKIAKKIEEQARYRCTYTDFLLLATARALVKHPLLNSSRKDDALMAQTQVNLGLTVESEQGLIVPVIPNAQVMSFVEIVKSRGDLLKAVKNKHLPPDQLSGSTFTITNLGMYGIRDFTAIINQNNSAILSVGEVVQRIRIHQGEPVVRSVMKISLNLDQRVANGVDGAKFLQEIKADMENPPLLLF